MIIDGRTSFEVYFSMGFHFIFCVKYDKIIKVICLILERVLVSYGFLE